MAARRGPAMAETGGNQNETKRSAACGHVERLKKGERLWAFVACIALLIAVSVSIAFVVYANHATVTDRLPSCGDDSGEPGDSGTFSTSAHRANELFDGFDEGDFRSVVDFLLRKLNLTRSSDATLSSNYIYMVERYLPSKDEALAYLESEALAPTPPAKRAKAVLFMGAARRKYVAEYVVWPVPRPTQLEPLLARSGAAASGSGNGAIPWRARPVCATVEGRIVRDFLARIVRGTLNRVLNESFGQWLGDGCHFHDACLYPMIAPRAKPRGADNSSDDERRLFCDFYRDRQSVDGNYLYPVAFQVLLRTPDNGDEFVVEYAYYNNRRFDSLDALRQAYDAGSVVQIRQPTSSLRSLDGRYASPRPRLRSTAAGKARDDAAAAESRSRRSPPTLASPDGRRFSLDGRHIEFMGWSFSLHFGTVGGLALLDVRHDGDPVAFEIGVQDIVVTYGGTEPHNLFKNFFDAGYSLGTLAYPLVRGVDCPPGAIYLDSVQYALGGDAAATLRDAACVFEHRNAVPIRRHYSADPPRFNYAFSVPDAVLVVRQIVTVWNYDYVFDYEFHQNGVLDARVSSTGYVVVTNTRNARYGLRLSEAADTLANVHGHYFHFKFDIDAAERRNSLTYIGIELEGTNNTLVQSGDYEQLRIVPQRIATEKQSLVRYNFTRPKYYVVHSGSEGGADALSGGRRNNSLGYARGYRIHAAGGFADVLLPPGNPQMRGAAWAAHQLTVTRRKETERSSSSLYTQGDPSDPVVDFASFYADDESLIDDDLVAWVTLGMHHVPCAEDLPVTTTPGRALVASLVPFNFFDDDPSVGSPDAAVFVRDAASGEPSAISPQPPPPPRRPNDDERPASGRRESDNGQCALQRSNANVRGV